MLCSARGAGAPPNRQLRNVNSNAVASIKAPIARCVVVNGTTALIGKRKYGVNLARNDPAPSKIWIANRIVRKTAGRDKRGPGVH